MPARSTVRPFDDHSVDRNRLEAEAVLIILQHVVAGEWEFAAGDAVEYEIDANPQPRKRDAVRGLLTFRTHPAAVDILCLHAPRYCRRRGFSHWTPCTSPPRSRPAVLSCSRPTTQCSGVRVA